MRPAFMFPRARLAICLYGLQTDTVDHIKLLCSSIFKFEHITYFEGFDSSCMYENLWISAFKKRQHELDSKRVFDVCLAIDATSSIDILSKPKIAELNISKYREEKLYFIAGEYFYDRGSTAISPSIFFSNSLIFDLACNFGKVFYKLPTFRKAKTIEEDFYYFLKTLKIKTRCVNYENSSLFKRTT